MSHKSNKNQHKPNATPEKNAGDNQWSNANAEALIDEKKRSRRDGPGGENGEDARG